VWTGGIGVLEAGYLKPGRTAVGLKAVGIIEQDVDNTAGANGDALCDVRRGVFRMANDAGDPVGRSHIGSNAYIVDDQTVAATDGAGTRSIAGTIVDIDDLGVWIEF
jgi:hypothetical protein